MEVSRHEAREAGKASPKPLVESELAQLARLAKRCQRLAGQIGDSGIVAAFDAATKLVTARAEAAMPADVRRVLADMRPRAPRTEPVDFDPDAPTVEPVMDASFFEDQGGETLEPADAFVEELPIEVLS